MQRTSPGSQPQQRWPPQTTRAAGQTPAPR
uniref:Uncharacterized protein n=1 Tax=Anguilla anguilla TaxID=7936 RepID=A0A0E9TPX6_ANGAN